MPTDQRYVALFDLHLGVERKNGRFVETHDPRLLEVVLKFLEDFKPHHLVLGGDVFQAESVSHWNDGKRGLQENLRIEADFKGQAGWIRRLESLVMRGGTKTFLIGNHEDWMTQYLEKHPELEDSLNLDTLVGLTKGGWKIIPQGGYHKLGKLYFIHGDTVRAGIHPAKALVDAYDRNIRAGHLHTYNAFTKISALDAEPKTGVSVPCLCQRAPSYGKGSPNRWLQGFEYGYLRPNGTFNDYIVIAHNRTFTINDTTYRG